MNETEKTLMDLYKEGWWKGAETVVHTLLGVVGEKKYIGREALQQVMDEIKLKGAKDRGLE